MVLALLGIVFGAVTIAALIERKRHLKAKQNGNGYDQLEEFTHNCKCKDI